MTEDKLTTVVGDDKLVQTMAALGIAATDIEVLPIGTTGLGPGLPDKVPILWDRRAQRPIGLREEIEKWRASPERRTGTAVARTVQAFIALVKRHADADTAIFADPEWRAPSMTAVIDYHLRVNADDGSALAAEREPARSGEHRIAYAFPLTDAWTAWVEQNGQPMSQADFAAWLEDHIAELAAPTENEISDANQFFHTRCADPADLLMLARGLEVAVEGRVKQAHKLQSGEAEIIFEEVHRDGQGQKLTVPGVFMIALPLFHRGEHARLPVRLRYRVRDGAVRWVFELHRPDEHVDRAIVKALDAVRVETGLPLYEGSPEA